MEGGERRGNAVNIHHKCDFAPLRAEKCARGRFTKRDPHNYIVQGTYSSAVY